MPRDRSEAPTLLDAGSQTRPCRLGLVVAPHQNPGENHKHRDYAGRNQNRINGHCDLLLRTRSTMPKQRMCALIRIKRVLAKSLDRRITALRRSQRLSARRIHEFHASSRDFDNAIALEFCECAAHGLDGQTEKICNIQAAHRQRYRPGRPPERG